MATFEVRIEADGTKCPVLLSNGNLVEKGSCNGRDYAIWADPFPKPSYLFALVAGDLGSIEDTFTTMSGRDVVLRFYSEVGSHFVSTTFPSLWMYIHTNRLVYFHVVIKLMWLESKSTKM